MVGLPVNMLVMDDMSQYKIPPEALSGLFVDRQGAANLLGRSPATVHDMVNRGVLTPYRVGTQVIYSRAECESVAAALQRLAARA